MESTIRNEISQDISATIDTNQFIRITYTQLLGAVATFVGLEVILFQTGIAQALAPIMSSNWLIVLGGFMILGWITGYFTNRQGSITMQYLQMGVTILLQAIIFIPLMFYAVYFSDPSVLSNAVLVTCLL